MRHALLATVLLASCGTPAAAPEPLTPTVMQPDGGLSMVDPTTTTTTTSTVVRRVRRRVAAQGGGFWRNLANCECASGRCGGPHIGYFQFSRDTAAKVGIDGSESYEEQRAAAQGWARRIHPREATRSGWPVCWARAAS